MHAYQINLLTYNYNLVAIVQNKNEAGDYPECISEGIIHGHSTKFYVLAFGY